MTRRIFIGWDARDEIAATVCASSLRRRTQSPVRYLRLDDPDVKTVYDRPYEMRDGQRYDVRSDTPFSTDFSFSRFLVPWLMDYKGFALFTDPDTIWMRSPDELFAMAEQHPEIGVWVVKHNHNPEENEKMMGLRQTRYPRKNWSSVCLWNCSHSMVRLLKPHIVNRSDGQYLHGLRWLDDEEIGGLDETWNWLAEPGREPWTGKKDELIPAVIHFTTGGPWFIDYHDVPFAGFWWDEAGDFWWEGRG